MAFVRGSRLVFSVLQVVVVGGLAVAVLRLVLGTALAPDAPQAVGQWLWLGLLAGLGLVVGRWWIVAAPIVIMPLAQHYLVFMGALRFFEFEWPFGALVLLVAATVV